MKRSLYAMSMSLVIGLFLMPGATYAESDRVATIGSPLEHASISISPVKHSFVVKLKNGVSSIFGKMKSLITGKGGSLEGTTESGSFQGKSALGMIKGEYRSISDTEIEITICDKPCLLPYSTIESEIRKYLT